MVEEMLAIVLASITFLSELVAARPHSWLAMFARV